jgi:hypothetical protein
MTLKAIEIEGTKTTMMSIMLELLRRQGLASAVDTLAHWHRNSVLQNLPWFLTDFYVLVIVNTCRGKSLCTFSVVQRTMMMSITRGFFWNFQMCCAAHGVCMYSVPALPWFQGTEDSVVSEWVVAITAQLAVSITDSTNKSYRNCTTEIRGMTSQQLFFPSNPLIPMAKPTI